jgi:uncharacterized membrane protein (Fun14 family)
MDDINLQARLYGKQQHRRMNPSTAAASSHRHDGWFVGREHDTAAGAAWIGAQVPAWFNAHGHNAQEYTRLPQSRVADVDGGSGDFDIIALPNQSGWLDELKRELSTASAGKQIAIGGISGWCSGYLVGRIGKAAALALGGSLIILQIANYQGLIHINWTRVQHSYESTRRRIGQHVTDNMSTFVENMRDLARQHICLAGSFAAGFLLGLAT